MDENQQKNPQNGDQLNNNSSPQTNDQMTADNQKPPFGPPPPQNPQLEIGTQESDIASIKKSGGGVPEPQKVNAEELLNSSNKQTTESQPAIIDESDNDQSKKWLIGLLVLVLVVVVGVLAWFYWIAPSLSTPSSTAPTEIPSQSPTPTETPSPAAAPQPIFGLGEPARLEAPAYSLVSILAALQDQANLMNGANPQEALFYVNNEPADFTSYLTALMPELANTPLPSFLTNNFESSFNILLFPQENEIWPVYVVRKKDNASIDQVTLLNQLSALESASIENLYLSPVSGRAVFRTGPVGESYSSRYAAFENKPASFNYGMFSNYFIISTTYQGLLKAIELLGL